MRDTVLSPVLATHIDPAPYAIPDGDCPTGTGSCRLPFSLITPTLFAGSDGRLDRGRCETTTRETTAAAIAISRAQAPRSQDRRRCQRRRRGRSPALAATTVSSSSAAGEGPAQSRVGS